MTTYQQRLIIIDQKRQIAALLLGIIAAVLRLWRSIFKLRKTNLPVRNVVIIEPFGMGDMISLEPLVRILKREGFCTHMCAREVWRPIFPVEHISGWLDSKIPWSSYEFKKKYAWRSILGPEFRKFLKDLQSIGKGAIGFDTRGDIRNVILLYLAGCCEVYTLSHYLGSDLMVFPFAARIVSARNDVPRWRLNLELLRTVGLTINDNVSPPSVNHLKPTKSSVNLHTVVLIPIAPWPGRLVFRSLKIDRQRRRTAAIMPRSNAAIWRF